MNGLPPGLPPEPPAAKQGILSQLVGGQSAKFIVAVLTAATTLLTHWADRWWQPPVVALLGAVAVWLVPNSPQN